MSTHLDKYGQRAYEFLAVKYPNMDENMLKVYAANSIPASMFDQFTKEHYERNGLILGTPPADYFKADIDHCASAIEIWVSGIRRGETLGLTIVGDAGRGKTYSALAAIKALENHHTTGFITDVGIISAIKETFTKYAETEKSVIDRFIAPYVLVIDDLGKANPTEWSTSYIFDIINRRYEQNRPTIITTQYIGTNLHSKLSRGADKETADAIISRISSYQIVKLTGKDLRRSA